MAKEFNWEDFDDSVEGESKKVTPKASNFDWDQYESQSEPMVEASPVEESGMGDAAIRGALQGATRGFSDELAGAVQASGDLLSRLGIGGPSLSETGAELASQGFTGDIGPTSTEELYQSARDEERKLNEQALASSPGSYLAGGFAGALATPMGATGLGGALAEGAATGAGLAEGSAPEVLGQAVLGAATGGLVNKAFSAGSGLIEKFRKPTEQIKNVGSALLDFGTTKNLKLGYEAGKAGSNILTKQGRSKLVEQVVQKTDDVSQLLESELQNLSKAKTDILNTAKEKVSLADQLGDIRQQLAEFSQVKAGEASNRDFTKLSKFLDDIMGKGPVTAKTVDQFRSQLGNEVYGNEAIGTKLGKQIAYDLENKLKSITDTLVPEPQALGALNKGINEILELKDNLKIGQPGGTSKLLNEIVKTGSTNEVTANMAQQKIAKNLGNLAEINPILATDVTEKIKDTGDRLLAVKAASRSHVMDKIYHELPIKAGNVIGLSKRSLDTLAAQFKGGSQAAQEVSEVFTKMADMDPTMQSAMVFSLQQNPAYRQTIEKVLPNFFTPKDQ